MSKRPARKNHNAAFGAVTPSASASQIVSAAGTGETAAEGSLTNSARLSLQAAQGNEASILQCSGIKTNEGESTVELTLRKLAMDTRAEDVSLTLIPEEPLVADGRYEVKLLCLGSSPGTLFVDKNDGSASIHEVRITRWWQEVRFTIMARSHRSGSPAFPRLLLGKFWRVGDTVFGSDSLAARTGGAACLSGVERVP